MAVFNGSIIRPTSRDKFNLKSVCILCVCVWPILHVFHIGDLPVWDNVEYTGETRNSAAVCSIQKGALKYIDEWIQYHIVLGFREIYIYDNSDDFELQKWHDSLHGDSHKKVVVRHLPGPRQQINAYKHCWQAIKEKGMHSWIAFFDIDEFLVIRNLTRYPTIIDFLDSLPPDYYGVAVNWVYFGFNNLTYWEEKPVTLRFQKRAVNATLPTIKTIVRAEVSPKMKNPHFVIYKENRSYAYKTKDTSGNIVRRQYNEALADDVVALYHYYTKSLEEYKERCNRGDVFVLPHQWNSTLPCQSDMEIMRRKGSFEIVLDDAPWRLLRERSPSFVKEY
mmetsp:Transcript_22087/g.54584  ORF Transcript_22087/g.54584 Transcript_22087/m.54584 type:complete len:335 (-) Transcript_22087:239-1243(-)